ncbi:HD domain-containing protein [Mucilaginibacter aquaedulcis]|uniref:HD domain-containing protein n=1 Tax=Mucilaginibacter aquaedulcis TaxID=1187081 RepID=UPI0025B57ADC|nr:HD domain-containing protein [Mucilaginibacter aquaedulcis]MDN3550836.1 HD domain-containing protein [Mucilaginibacter aquaedulcis]
MKSEINKILQFLHVAENLKRLTRHSWLSDGRQESVAEHTWRVSIMFLLVEPHLGIKVDSTRIMKMIIIHDIIEALVGDVPAFDTFNEDVKKLKIENETRAIEDIREQLDNTVGDEFFDLWHEFEAKVTNEAKVANALDKLEAQVQHNEADINTWLDIEKEMLYMMDRHVNFNEFLTQLKDAIVEEGALKLATLQK